MPLGTNSEQNHFACCKFVVDRLMTTLKFFAPSHIVIKALKWKILEKMNRSACLRTSFNCLVYTGSGWDKFDVDHQEC